MNGQSAKSKPKPCLDSPQISTRPSTFGPPESTQWAPIPDRPFSAFGGLNQFKDAQRMAMMLAHSSIVPENYRGDEHVGDCVLVLEIANRIGASVLAVMQNLQVIQGRAGWSSQFLISCLNATKRFSPIRYRLTGTRGEDSRGCIAWAADKSGEVLQSPEVTVKMAKDEGWYYRLGSKWQTMPELMLCYRSATLFTRLYAPEITMGIQTTDEMVDIGKEGNGQISRPVFEGKSKQPKAAPKLKAKPRRHLGFGADLGNEPAPTNGETQDPRRPQCGESKNLERAPTSTTAPGPTRKPDFEYLKALTGLIGLSPFSEALVIEFLCARKKCEGTFTSLAELAKRAPEAIAWAHDHWKSLDQELSQNNNNNNKNKNKDSL